ncbi:MAG: toxin-antitoxin system antidote component [Phormidium sp. OSCR]|nr:MAG: toxin-antitoxin system antidote component [Phormidium sp. OSCR]
MKHQKLPEIIELIKNWFNTHYSVQVVQIILYGSQARGEANPDSDIDLLIVMKSAFNYTDEIEKTSEFIQKISLEYETVVSRAFVSEQRFNQEKSPFILNVHREGIVL